MFGLGAYVVVAWLLCSWVSPWNKTRSNSVKTTFVDSLDSRWLDISYALIWRVTC
jgi:hypothetical protein